MYFMQYFDSFDDISYALNVGIFIRKTLSPTEIT